MPQTKRERHRDLSLGQGERKTLFVSLSISRTERRFPKAGFGSLCQRPATPFSIERHVLTLCHFRPLGISQPLRFPFMLFVLLLITGCQRYSRKPLTDSSIDCALSPSEIESLWVESSTLRHPLLPPLAVNPSDGISPDEAAVLAVLLNPSLRSERDRRSLADAQIIQAGLLPNPQFSWSTEDPIGGMTEGTVRGVAWGLDWSLRELVTRRARLSEAQFSRSAVDLEILWKEWQLSQAAKLAVYQAIGLNQQLLEASENRDRLADNLDRVRQAADSGFMTDQDLAAAEAASFQARSTFLDLKKQAGNQKIRLNQALGFPPELEVPLQEDSDLPSHFEPPSQEEILSGLEERRLDLVALRRGYQSQESAVRQAILEQFPNISIGVNRAKDTGDVITRGFGISIDLPLFDLNEGGIASEKATRQILYDDYIQRIFETRSEIAALIYNATSLNLQIESVQEEIPRLTHLVDTYREAVDRKQADILNYYSVWNDLTEKRLDLIGLKLSLVETQIALEIASGTCRLEALSGGERPPSILGAEVAP